MNEAEKKFHTGFPSHTCAKASRRKNIYIMTALGWQVRQLRLCCIQSQPWHRAGSLPSFKNQQFLGMEKKKCECLLKGKCTLPSKKMETKHKQIQKYGILMAEV